MTERPTPIGLFTVSPALTVTTWDDWMANATGRTPASVQGQSLTALYPELETRGLAAKLRETVTEGTVHTLAPVFHGHFLPCPTDRGKPDSPLMRQRTTIAPLRDENADVTGALITIEDVSHRLDREKELADQLKSGDAALRLDAVRSLEWADDVSLWTAGLADRHWSVRRESVARLTRSDAGAMDALLSAMKNNHADPGLLNSALQVFVSLGLDVVTPLIGCLRSPDKDLRIYAALALGDQRDPRATQALISALNDDDVNVRFHSIESLGRLRAADAAGALCDIAVKGDFYLGYPALEALRQMRFEGAAPVAAALLANSMLQEAATDVLAVVGGAAEAAALTRHLLLIGPVPACLTLAAMDARHRRPRGQASVIGTAVAAEMSATAASAIVAALDTAGESDTRALVGVLSWLPEGPWTRALAVLLENDAARERILSALVDLGRPGARVLERLVSTDDEEVRRLAVTSLGSVGDVASVPALVSALDEPELTVLAAGAIARIGAASAFEPVIRLIGHPDAAVRKAAISALNSMGHPDLEARVRPLLKGDDALLKESALRIAGYFGYRDAFDDVAALMSDADETVRRAAIESVAYFEDSRVLALLAEASGRPDAVSQTAAMRALAFLQEPRANELLRQGLESPQAWTRYFAARSLGRHEDAAAVPALADRLAHDPAVHVRAAAAEALGAIGGAESVAHLTAVLQSKDADVARAAIEALGRISGPGARRALEESLLRSEGPAAALAATALGRRGDADAAPALLAAAQRGDGSLAEAAVAALGRISAPAAVAALLRLSEKPDLRALCVETLGAAPDALVPDLARGLNDPSVAVRTCAVESLARMRRPSASDRIGRALHDASAPVRLAAVTALASLGNRDFRADVAHLARHDDDPAVAAAARRTAQI